jgi:hypothetical protein
MTAGGLKAIAEDMRNVLGLKYDFMECQGKPPDTYFIGEYQEVEPLTEDGEQEAVFILTGFSRKSFSELERCREKIRRLYHPVEGRMCPTESGSVMAVYYGNSIPLPTGDAEIKKIQINLQVKEWEALR